MNTATRSSRRHVPAATRILAAALVFVIGLAVVMNYAAHRFDNVHTSVVRVQSAEIAQARLRDLESDYATVYGIWTSVRLDDPVEIRIATLTKALIPSQQLLDAFTAYTKASLNLPGEAAVVAHYNKAGTSYGDAGRAAGPVVVSGVLDVDRARHAIATISKRYAVVIADVHHLESMYQRFLDAELRSIAARVQGERRRAFAVAAGGTLFVIVAAGFFARSARRRDRAVARLEGERAQVARRNEFEARLQRALSMTSTEAAVHDVIGDALTEVLEDHAAQVLVAESSRAPFQTVATTGAPFEGCSVSTPTECVAARLGQPFDVGSSRALDACPFMKDRAAGPSSARCVPVVVADRPLGVVHIVGPEHETIGPAVESAVTLVARRCGEKIGNLRAFARSQAQASTDPLTGLANRRTLEERAAGHVASDRPYAVAFGDLDHFKELNDTYGHEAGDHALRVFAEALNKATRPEDLTVRYGGEEFVLLLPECDRELAVTIAERVRDMLRRELAGTAVPRFTVSFGVATNDDADTFDAVVRAADRALLAAKAAGRDCVRVALRRDASAEAA